ncbi:adhesin-like protein [Histomonas meleagridis]|uniref:adhesin-like protein n=1 Tax=Histomonas meleagridis TaxID=135588 RepID=UPI00355A04E5|nr:adhesin-like protein [Histomonas meleagridis]KAH0806332.1 adhesin-like protein [Histomonas meleagridis]
MDVTITKSIFKETTKQLFSSAGAVQIIQCNVKIDMCIFSHNKALYSGSVEISDSPSIIFNNSLIEYSSAYKFGAMMFDGHEASNVGNIINSNFSFNAADSWVGGVRLQHNHGTVKFSTFSNNKAHRYAALFDYTHKPAERIFDHVSFINNTATDYGAGFTSYHLLYVGVLRDCIFYGNRNQGKLNGRSVLLQSDCGQLKISNCVFEGNVHDEVLAYFPLSEVSYEGANVFQNRTNF